MCYWNHFHRLTNRQSIGYVFCIILLKYSNWRIINEMELIIISCFGCCVVISPGMLLSKVLILLFKINRLLIILVMTWKTSISRRLITIWRGLSTLESLLMPCLWILFISNIYRPCLMKFFKQKIIRLCRLVY